jgi:hypothetical protein
MTTVPLIGLTSVAAARSCCATVTWAAAASAEAWSADLLADGKPDRGHDAVDRRGQRGTAGRLLGAVHLGLVGVDGRLVGRELRAGRTAGLVLG